MTARRVARRARKTHVACEGRCEPIRFGEVYVERTEFPSAGPPVRSAECRDHAEHLVSQYANPSPSSVRRRQPRLYIRSRQCQRCGDDYLYPAYGNAKNVCNNCIWGDK